MAWPDDIGARSARHHDAPSERLPVFGALTTPSTTATTPAVPNTSSTSLGSQVGSASGANAACANRRYADTRLAAPLTPTIFRTKSIGNTIRPSATAATGMATMATDTARAHTMTFGTIRHSYSRSMPS